MTSGGSSHLARYVETDTIRTYQLSTVLPVRSVDGNYGPDDKTSQLFPNLDLL